MPSNHDAFRPVTRDDPCKVCGKPDWCRRSASGGHECHRRTEQSVNSFVRVAETPAGYAVYRQPTAQQPSPSGDRESRSPQAYASSEAAATAYAAWKNGTVEAIHRWTPTWCRARIRLADGKTFCEITKRGSGWVQRGPASPRPLYRQQELPADGIVFVCEGEKACDAGWRIGLPCVTSGAADSAARADWTALRGRDVVVLPDCDDTGEKYVTKVVASIQALDQPARVRVLRLPGLGHAEDLHEFVTEHRDGKQAEEIVKEIQSLIEHTPLEVQADHDGPGPQPLPDELPPVGPFRYELLPDSLREYVQDIAERVQCPPDFVAITLMIVLATAVGRKLGIRPKRRDDWTAVPNLWGAAIGLPGVLKTPAIQEPMNLLRTLEIEAKHRFDDTMQAFEARKLVAGQRRMVAKKKVRKAIETGGDAVAEAKDALDDDDEDEPVRRRYIVNDSSVEKLGEILNENPNGVLCFRDELIGLFKSLEKDGQEGARAFYLEAWNGDGRFTYDRIARGTVDIEAAIISVVGSIQPGPLREYMLGAVRDGGNADGLMQRLQLAVYPDIDRNWRNVDRWPNKDAKQKATEVVRALDALAPVDVYAEVEPDAVPFLRFDADAQQLFDGWRAELERRVRASEDHPAITAHLSKYRSLVPALALLIHLAERRKGPVVVEPIQKAIAWARYLESHARRIYAIAVRPDIAEARELADKIATGKLPAEFALRDIYRKGWLGLGTREAAQRAVDVLIDLDWLEVLEEPTPGRTRTRYRVNPKVRRPPDQEPTELTEGSS